MELTKYLQDNYYTKQVLLELSNTPATELLRLQTDQLMPMCSYKLSHKIKCHSFFGEYELQEDTEYFAKGYVEWLEAIRDLDAESAFSAFSNRYKKQLGKLQKQGLNSANAKLKNMFGDEFDEHIKSEWQHFLNGTYGLCTQSGLPEDIASKELAILEISRLISTNKLSIEF